MVYDVQNVDVLRKKKDIDEDGDEIEKTHGLHAIQRKVNVSMIIMKK